jgi:hypothetical protein
MKLIYTNHIITEEQTNKKKQYSVKFGKITKAVFSTLTDAKTFIDLSFDTSELYGYDEVVLSSLKTFLLEKHKVLSDNITGVTAPIKHSNEITIHPSIICNDNKLFTKEAILDIIENYPNYILQLKQNEQ